MRHICLFLLVVLIVPVYAEGANNLNGEETEKMGVMLARTSVIYRVEKTSFMVEEGNNVFQS